MRTALSEATKINLTAILSETCRVLKCLIALRAISLLRKVRGFKACLQAGAG